MKSFFKKCTSLQTFAIRIYLKYVFTFSLQYNTVLIGDLGQFFMRGSKKEEPICCHTYQVPAYYCYVEAQRCELLGRLCRSYHHASSGHYSGLMCTDWQRPNPHQF